MNEKTQKAIANFIKKLEQVNSDKAMLNDSMNELDEAKKRLYDYFCEEWYDKTGSFVNTSFVVNMDGITYLLVFDSTGAPRIERTEEVINL